MQQVMRLFAVWLAEILFIKPFNNRRIVRTSDFKHLILIIKRLGAQFFYRNRISGCVPLNRLTAAVYAPARARHDLYKLIGRIAAFHFLAKFSCLCKPACGGNFYLHARNIVSCGSYAVYTPDLAEINQFEIAVKDIRRRS